MAKHTIIDTMTGAPEEVEIPDTTGYCHIDYREEHRRAEAFGTAYGICRAMIGRLPEKERWEYRVELERVLRMWNGTPEPKISEVG